MSSKRGEGLGTMAPKMREARHYYDWLAQTLQPHAGRRILEIGPGFGDLAERFAGSEIYLGLDASEEVAAHLRQRFEGKRWFDVLVDDALGAGHCEELRARRIDTVLAVNVLEHLADDSAALRLWAELAPGARLLLFVPALEVLYGTLDEQAGHYRRYTCAGLDALLKGTGVQVESVRYFNAIGALGWFVSGRVLRQDIDSGGTGILVKAYDRCVLPVARLLDPVLRPFWGQSVVAVGRLPAR